MHAALNAPSAELFRITFEKAAIGIGYLNAQERWQQANPHLCRLLGYSADVFHTLTLADVVAHDDYDEVSAAHQALVRGEQDEQALETCAKCSDGSELWVRLTLSAVRGFAGDFSRGFANGNEPPGEASSSDFCIVVAEDIDARKHIEEVLEREAERAAYRIALADALRPLLDPAAVKRQALELLGAHLHASRVHYAESTDEGRTFRIEDNYTDGVDAVKGDYRLEDFGPALVNALYTGEVLIVPDVVQQHVLSEAERAGYAVLHIGAYVAVPLIRAGKLIAILSVHQTEARPWTGDEVTIITETAERIWTAVERARVETALHKAAARDAFRIMLADALRPLTDPMEVKREANRQLGRFLGANRVHYVEVTDDGEHFIIEDNYLDGVSDVRGTFRMDDFGPSVVARLRGGEVLVIHDLLREVMLTPEEQASYAMLQIAASVTMPLIRNGQLAALLSVHQTTARQWTEDEVTLIAETAERVWIAVERVRAETELRISEARYRSLFNSVDEGFAIAELIFDEANNPVDYRMIELNPHFEKLTGLPAAEALSGKTIRQIAPTLEEKWYQIYGRVAQTGEPIRFETDSQALGHIYDVYAFRIDAPEQRHVAILYQEITERKQAEAQQRQREAEQAVLETRQHLARDLHDAVSQTLFSANLTAEALPRLWPDMPDGLRDKLDDLRRQTRGAQAEMRTLLLELRPEHLETIHLAQQLRQLVEALRARKQVELDLRIDDGLPLPPPVRIAFYRIAQEALNNIIKHARAHGVGLCYQTEGTAEHPAAVLTITDDGMGFDGDPRSDAVADIGEARPQFGVRGMYERATEIGATLHIRSTPGAGTHLRLYWAAPLQSAHGASAHGTSPKSAGLPAKT